MFHTRHNWKQISPEARGSCQSDPVAQTRSSSVSYIENRDLMLHHEVTLENTQIVTLCMILCVISCDVISSQLLKLRYASNKVLIRPFSDSVIVLSRLQTTCLSKRNFSG